MGHANIKCAYGLSFKVKHDITCSGIEVFAKFNGVLTKAVLRIPDHSECHQYNQNRSKTYKLATNHDGYNSNAPIREFVFQKQESVTIRKGDECRIGFILSDGAYLDIFGTSGAMKDNEDIEDVHWQQFSKSLGSVRSGVGGATSYHWNPLIRILC